MNERKYRHRGYQSEAPIESRRGPPPPSSRLEGAPRGRTVGRPSEEVFRCRACGTKNEPGVAPSSACVKCGAALHACNQCRSFDTGSQFQCRQTIPEPIPAKSRGNECALYEPAVSLDLTGQRAASTPDTARAAFDKLFGKK